MSFWVMIVWAGYIIMPNVFRSTSRAPANEYLVYLSKVIKGKSCPEKSYIK